MASSEETASWSPNDVNFLNIEGLGQRNRAVYLYRNSGVCRKVAEEYKGYFQPAIHGALWHEAPYKASIYHSPSPDNAHPQGEIYHLDKDPDKMENLWMRRRRGTSAIVIYSGPLTGLHGRKSTEGHEARMPARRDLGWADLKSSEGGRGSAWLSDPVFCQGHGPSKRSRTNNAQHGPPGPCPKESVPSAIGIPNMVGRVSFFGGTPCSKS